MSPCPLHRRPAAARTLALPVPAADRRPHATALALSALLLAAGALLALPAQAQTAAPAAQPSVAPAPASTRLIPAASQVRFVTRQMGVPVEGHFKRFDAQLAFDPRQPQAGRVAFTVELASAEIGDASTTAELKKPDWFDTARFPRASFQSTAIKAASPGRFEVSGNLTIKGKSRPLVVPVTLARAGAHQVATGSFTLKRLAYDIGGGDWADPSMVADEVQVDFRLTVAGLPG